jgi:hypothetical protein
MANQLYQQMMENQLSQNNNLQQVKQMMNMFKTMKNPQSAIMQMAQSNPQINSIMQLVGNRNPKDVFMEECQKRGIDPNMIINQLK